MAATAAEGSPVIKSWEFSRMVKRFLYISAYPGNRGVTKGVRLVNGIKKKEEPGICSAAPPLLMAL